MERRVPRPSACPGRGLRSEMEARSTSCAERLEAERRARPATGVTSSTRLASSGQLLRAAKGVKKAGVLGPLAIGTSALRLRLASDGGHASPL